MIKNILFDMGGVLLVFDREYFISKQDIVNEEDKKLLNKEVFLSVDWANLDRGILTEQEVYDNVIKRIPERLHKAAHNLIFDWDNYSYQIDKMNDLLKVLKDNGYNLYLLSNASSRLHEYAPRIISNFNLFDGVIVSADIKVVKPQTEIFEYPLKKYNLIAHECLFIDDMPLNVGGAMANKYEGIVFYGDVDELKKHLKEKGVNC